MKVIVTWEPFSPSNVLFDQSFSLDGQEIEFLNRNRICFL